MKTFVDEPLCVMLVRGVDRDLGLLDEWYACYVSPESRWANLPRLCQCPNGHPTPNEARRCDAVRFWLRGTVVRELENSPEPILTSEQWADIINERTPL